MAIDPHSPASPERAEIMEEAPRHPVPQLQGPFEESMIEAMVEEPDSADTLDAHARRVKLLENKRYERMCAGRWKQRKGEKYHPLWKLSAQMSFGIHLLAHGLAKSEEEVMNILQAHVDDIDGFLERTTEDFELAQSDIEERLRYLRLPLDHLRVFDRMLEDRKFRGTIVAGNEKIEHIVGRTNRALRDALKDCQKGLYATKSLGKYLQSLEDLQEMPSSDFEAVHIAMMGNCKGWHGAFKQLLKKGNDLSISLVQLLGVVDEMQRRCGMISRKGLMQSEDQAQKPKAGDTAGSPEKRPVKPLGHVSQQDLSLEAARKKLAAASDTLKAQEISLAHEKSQSKQQPRPKKTNPTEPSRKQHESHQTVLEKPSAPVARKSKPSFRRFLSGADVKADLRESKILKKRRESQQALRRESQQMLRGHNTSSTGDDTTKEVVTASSAPSSQNSRPPYPRLKPVAGKHSQDSSPSSASKSSKMSKGWSNDSSETTSSARTSSQSGSHLSLKIFSRKQSESSQSSQPSQSQSEKSPSPLPMVYELDATPQEHSPIKLSPDPGLPTPPFLAEFDQPQQGAPHKFSALPEEPSSNDARAKGKGVAEKPKTYPPQGSNYHLTAGPVNPFSLVPSPADSVDDPMKMAIPMILDVPAPLPLVPARSQKRGPSPSKDATARLLDDIIATTTPPASPIDGPNSPWAALLNNNSRGSDQVWASDSSLYHSILSPPRQAEPPAPPGGRKMVSPNYGMMGAFQGERKNPSGRNSTGLPPMSPTSWKRMFASGGGGPAIAKGATTGDMPTLPPFVDESQWFKGLGRDGIWETVQ